jgi:hypothetical protein
VRSRLSQLTARERQVLTLVVTGMPNKQIASSSGHRKDGQVPAWQGDAEDAGALAGRSGLGWLIAWQCRETWPRGSRGRSDPFLALDQSLIVAGPRSYGSTAYGRHIKNGIPGAK